MADTVRTSAAYPVTCEPVAAGSEGETLEQVQENGTETPCFVSEHLLFAQVKELSDLPSGTIYVRKSRYEFLAVRTEKIPADKQADLHKAIRAGSVFAIIDARRQEFDDLDHGWNRNTDVRVLKMRSLAKRHGCPRNNLVNNEEGA